VIAYSHCIAHGIEMRDGLSQQHRAVASGTGHWSATTRSCTVTMEPHSCSTRRARGSRSTLHRRVSDRYRALADTQPEEAERCDALAERRSHNGLAGL